MVVGAVGAAGEAPASTLETTDFLKTWALRKTIHDRERGACFYCLRRTPAYVQCLDHVRATRTLRTQFLAQPGFLLYRMQHAQGRPSGPGFSAHSLPPGSPNPETYCSESGPRVSRKFAKVRISAGFAGTAPAGTDLLSPGLGISLYDSRT